MQTSVDLKVAANGRVVLPRVLRQALGLSGESRLVAVVDGDEVRLAPIGRGIRRAQELYRAHAKIGRSVDDFLSDRKQEDAGDG